MIDLFKSPAAASLRSLADGGSVEWKLARSTRRASLAMDPQRQLGERLAGTDKED